MDEADRIIDGLGLSPHPEGGFYRQTWVAEGPGRPVGTAILFLLKSGQASHWHRVDAVEIWHFHAGAPVILSLAETAAGPARDLRLGPEVLGGETPQAIVPSHHWQAARSTGFQFAGFDLAPPGFDIPRQASGGGLAGAADLSATDLRRDARR